MKVVIRSKNVTMQAELNDSRTARAVLGILPIDSRMNLWGEEVYFNIPVEAELENPVEVVSEGDLGYWPTGKAFCIFFGKTPVSTDSEIKPYSAVTLLGRLLGNPKEWKKARDGEKIRVEKA